MTVPELKTLLAQHGIPQAIHDRGQHFLLSEAVVARVVESAAAEPEAVVLEVGPGPGILTGALLAAGREVVAVEIDPKMCALQRTRFGGDARFHLHDGDVRDVTNAALLSEAGMAGRPFVVAANIPYNLTSALITRFLSESPRPRRVTLLIQKEVGERITAQPGDLSAFAIFVQTLAEARVLMRVPAGQFYPPPQVDSCVVELVPRTPEEVLVRTGGVAPEAFFAFVRAGFAQPRKKLRNTLAGQFADLLAMERAFAQAGLSLDARPEEVAVEQWGKLAAAR
jgi:16S rRNA (adenine1518-N6/adenine1519-N6)-dimethyltransferase